MEAFTESQDILALQVAPKFLAPAQLSLLNSAFPSVDDS